MREMCGIGGGEGVNSWLDRGAAGPRGRNLKRLFFFATVGTTPLLDGHLNASCGTGEVMVEGMMEWASEVEEWKGNASEGVILCSSKKLTHF